MIKFIRVKNYYNYKMLKKELSPICLFTYNRLYETKKTIEALKKNNLAKDSILYVFSDGPKKESDLKDILRVRNYIENIDGFKKIILYKSKKNKGLVNSIIPGITKIINKHKKIIVLEDDIITSKKFLKFMNEALKFYKNDKKIKTISGFSLDINCKESIYFQTRPFPWGWGTWVDRWNSKIFDKKKIAADINENRLKLFKKKCGSDMKKMLIDSLKGKDDSWDIRWMYNHFREKKYTIYPNKSLTINIGFNNRGTHCNEGINCYKCKFDNTNQKNYILTEFRKPNVKERIKFLKYFKKSYRLKVRIKLLFSKTGFKRVMKDTKNKLKEYLK